MDPMTIMALVSAAGGLAQSLTGASQKRKGEDLIQNYVNDLKNYNPDVTAYDKSVNLYQNQVGQGSMSYPFQDYLNRVQGNLSNYLSTSLATGKGTSNNAFALNSINDELSKIAVTRQKSLENAVDSLSKALIDRSNKQQEIYDIRNLESSKIENYGVGSDLVRTGSENKNKGLDMMFGAATSLAGASANKDMINALSKIGAQQIPPTPPTDATNLGVTDSTQEGGDTFNAAALQLAMKLLPSLFQNGIPRIR